MNLSALITIKRLLEMAIEQAKTELEQSKKNITRWKTCTRWHRKMQRKPQLPHRCVLRTN